MLNGSNAEAASQEMAAQAEALGTKAMANEALSKAHEIRALGSALLHVLISSKDADYEPLTTAIALAGVVAEQSEALANRIDKISPGLSSFRREKNVEPPSHAQPVNGTQGHRNS
jgi:hypothetical protein